MELTVSFRTCYKHLAPTGACSFADAAANPAFGALRPAEATPLALFANPRTGTLFPMGRNVEIKARVSNMEALLDQVKAIADFGPTHLSQDDTFFVCPNGRLKLRAFSPSNGELIYYQRPNSAGPKESQYSIVPTSEPDALQALLTQCLGQAGRVRKTRTLFLAGRTRIHLDCVEGLGNFLELEVVLADGEPVAEGMKVASELLSRLEIPTETLVEGAYVDLLKG